MTPEQFVKSAAELQRDLKRSEGEALLPLYLAGVRIVPSDMVDRTTVMVTPKTYEALKAAIART